MRLSKKDLKALARGVGISIAAAMLSGCAAWTPGHYWRRCTEDKSICHWEDEDGRWVRRLGGPEHLPHAEVTK